MDFPLSQKDMVRNVILLGILFGRTNLHNSAFFLDCIWKVTSPFHVGAKQIGLSHSYDGP